MNKGNSQKLNKKITATKEFAFMAVMVSLLLVSQFALSAVAGVELVTVLFVAYSFSFGIKRGTLVATAFSFLRQLLFGFFVNVLILYLLYYNILCVCFGLIGKKLSNNIKGLVFVVVVSCLATVCFSLLDWGITSVYLQYSWKASKAYLLSSLPVMGVQVLNTALTVSILFLPLTRTFSYVKRAFL